MTSERTDALAKVTVRVNTLGDLVTAVNLLRRQGFKDTDEVNPDSSREALPLSLPPDMTSNSLASSRRITADLPTRKQPRLVIWMQRTLVITDETEDDLGRNE